MNERRSIRRTDVLKNVKIIANRTSFRCELVDLTNIGACITFAETNKIPDDFELAFGAGPSRRRCRVKWRTGNQLGVAFE
jgi:hypothetical protein